MRRKESNQTKTNKLSFKQFLMVWKITFTTLGDLPWMLQVRIQRGGQGVRTPPPPWKITSDMGSYRE